MATEIVMPRLSDSMEEGTILRWFLAEGDDVAEGEPLVEVETDKASVTYEAEVAGTLLHLAAQTGESVGVGAVLAVVGEPGETVTAAGGAAFAAAETSGTPAATATAPPPAAPAPTAGGPAARPAPAPDGRVKASPLARRIARELGIDLATLAGTGPQGRVTRADVERSSPGDGAGGTDGAAAAAPAPQAEPAVGAKGETTRREPTRMQQTIARRMAQSRATVPDFELRVEVDMGALVALRGELRGVSDRAPSVNDFIVKAAALTLREFPRVNGSYHDGGFEEHGRVNVGVAVAADDALLVPTVFDADEKSLGQVAAATRALATKAREGSITPAELAGSTFSVSNLGMFGVDSFSAVINEPQAAILAVGALKPRPIVTEDGALVARPTVQLSLACDHRILYGADGARFIARLRERLEQPLGLLL